MKGFRDLSLDVCAFAFVLVSTLLLAMASLSGCSSEMPSGNFSCELNQPDNCPPGWFCQCRGAGCEARCYESSSSYCGDGVVDPGEECDGVEMAEGAACADGGFPFCRVDCRLACTECGNGIIEATPAGPREECDDGNLLDSDNCSSACLLARCGNGVVDHSLQEGCDEGAANSDTPGARCRMNCQLQRCGDGIVDLALGEVCDDGNLDPADQCSMDCLSKVVCGNGYVDAAAGEGCDDGNGLSHDGCSSDCFKETPWAVGTPPEPKAFPEGWSPLLSARFGHAMAYDAARGRMVLFGGRAHRTSEQDLDLGDTWEWDGSAWFRITGAGPGAMSTSQDMTYDAVRKRVVMVNNGVWEWNGASWSRLPIAAGSAEPQWGRIAYDAGRDRLVVFAGATWEWEARTRIWRDVSPPAGSPAAESGSLIYDPSVGRTVYVGSKVWEWNGEAWTLVSGALSLGAHTGKVLAYDTGLGKLIWTTDGDAVWTWDSRHHTLAAAPALPGEQNDRIGAALAHHGAGGRTILVGGVHSSTVWELEGNAWKQAGVPMLALPEGSHYLQQFDERRGKTWALGLGGETHNWISQDRGWMPAPTSASRPPSDGPAAYDPQRGSVVMITGAAAAQVTWEWNGTRWTSTSTPMTPALGERMFYDSARKRILNVAGPRLQTRAWTGAAWQDVSNVSDVPEDRFFAGMVHDRVRGNLVHFGGYHGDQLTAEVLELRGARWMSVPGRGPAPAESPVIWFDPDRQRTIYKDVEVWEWDGAAWRDVTRGVTSLIGPATRTATLSTALRSLSLAEPPRLAEHTGSVAPPGLPLRFAHLQAREETCRYGFDTDGDGRIGCDDPDCWRSCSPTCSPGQDCPPDAPRCGDGECDQFLENNRLCPADCRVYPRVCGDFLCDPGETATDCPGDCH